jgi:hypothetical protein
MTFASQKVYYQVVIIRNGRYFKVLAVFFYYFFCEAKKIIFKFSNYFFTALILKPNPTIMRNSVIPTGVDPSLK